LKMRLSVSFRCNRFGSEAEAVGWFRGFSLLGMHERETARG
jgi:hypothetical protein